MTYEQIITDLRNKIYHPVYFLMGEEPYYIDALTDLIEDSILTPAEKGFNQTVVYGRDVTIAEIVAMARRYPMMANYQVVIVKEAQDLFKANDIQRLMDVIKVNETLESAKFARILPVIREKNLRNASDAAKAMGSEKSQDLKLLDELFSHIQYLSSEPAKKYAGLINLLDHPVKSTILVFAYKYAKLDRRRSFAKKLEQSGVLFESTRLYENKIPEWITYYLRERRYAIDIPATALLTEYLGTDLARIANELQKLIINIPEGTRIDTSLIEKYIGISKDYNVFELQKALGAGDMHRTMQIVNYFAANSKENPVVKTIAMLFGFFTKLLLLHSQKDKSPQALAAVLSINPFFVKDYLQAARVYPEARVEAVIRLLREYDMKAKGVGNVSLQDAELTRELIYRIMH